MFDRLNRRRLEDTNYGRSQGWDLELGGVVVAHLDDPRFEDMFWFSYTLVPLTSDPALAELLLSDAFWRGHGWHGLVFRSRALGIAADAAFPALTPFVAPGRLMMRGLYITPEQLRAPSPDETLEERIPRGFFARVLDRLLGRAD